MAAPGVGRLPCDVHCTDARKLTKGNRRPMSDEQVQAAVDPAVDAALSTIDWQGVTVTIPKDLEDVDPDVVEAFENGKAVTALRAMFGTDEYDRARAEFKKQHGRRPTMRDMGSMSEAVAQHFGFESAGE